MPPIETALPPTESGLQKIKNIIGKLLYPRAEKTRLVELSRERVEELISQFPEDEIILRQDLLRRFERTNGKKIPKDLSWFEIEDLFEAHFKKMNGQAYEFLSEKLGYTRELLTEVMHCVGRGQQLETKNGKSTLT